MNLIDESIKENDNYQGPGIYVHYKGPKYLVHGLALHESMLYRLVIYEPLESGSKLDHTPIRFWARPIDDFNEQLGSNKTIPRFQKIGHES